MPFLRRWLALGIVVLLTAAQLSTGALAQNSGTPAAGTPVTAGDELAGRLGGNLAGVEALYGAPDFMGDGLIRYDNATVGGLPTILVVYYDTSETVTRMALVYPVRPTELTTPQQVLDTAAAISPADGSCQSATIASDFGAEVYPCASSALASVFTAEKLTGLGVTQGNPGDYSIAVDPLPDAYFELIVQPGTSGTSLAPTPVPGEPTPTPTPTLAERYPALTDPNALLNGQIPLGGPLSFTGKIVTLQVAEFGMQFKLGEDGSLGASSLFQVRVPAQGTAGDAVLFVGYNGDATALAIGDTVTVYGQNYGTQCFENQEMAEICQALIAADDVVEK